MKRYTCYILSAVISISCSRARQDIVPERGNEVRWSIVSVDGYGTKSLVDNLNLLEKACTPVDKNYEYKNSDGTQITVPGLGQTIGIWADYTVEIDGEEQYVSNVFNSTSLMFNPESASDTKWEYASDPAYWVVGGKYVFRAYYPKNELNVNMSLSNAKSLTIEMNTAKTQRDMLVAYNSYDTKTGDYTYGPNSEEAGLSNPVKMNFRHTMSALKFNFKFYDGADGILFSRDRITSCWLEAEENESFALTGYMVYGDGADAFREGLVQWRNQYYPGKGVKFYHWACADGVEFSNVDNGAGGMNQEIAVAYSRAGSAEDDMGAEYAAQDGWLVIIPQVSTGKVKLCFTTMTGGDAVFSILLPSVTGTSRAKYDEFPDEMAKQKDASGCDFIPGWRYTYTISISKTEADMNLSIAPWRRLDSSFDIKF